MSMTLRDLINRSGGELDRPLFFLPFPDANEYIEIESMLLMKEEDLEMLDDWGNPVPSNAIVLFPS
jgi:hypothetical protein